MIRQFGTGDFFYLVWATRWTVLLSLIAFAGGGALALVIALARISQSKIISYLAIVYIRFFQGTPLLIQLFLALFLPGLFDVRFDPLMAAAVALSLNSSAFLGEIWRGCIQSIPTGQWDGARALGLRRMMTLRLIILPQAVRISIPPTVGYLVQLIKATSLASVIGFTELTRAGQLLINTTYRPFLIFSIIATLYFLVCWPLSKASRILEAKLAEAPRA
jgi:polar amino acid transport system permease protein